MCNTALASEKLSKKVLRLIGEAAKQKCLRRGIKEVVWSIRKKEKGIVVMAGDVFPVDVIAHIPLLCEEADIPYCYISRKSELGAAGLTRRATSVVLVTKGKGGEELASKLKEIGSEVDSLQPEV